MNGVINLASTKAPGDMCAYAYDTKHIKHQMGKFYGSYDKCILGHTCLGSNSEASEKVTLKIFQEKNLTKGKLSF